MKHKVIGMLGCGNVGSGMYTLLQDMADDIARREKLTIQVKKILVRDASKQREGIPAELLTTDAQDILEDEDITLLVECMGGEEPATTLMAEALRRGKAVVTANKMAIALNWHILQQASLEGGASLQIEASVCGAVPVIRVLNDSMQANRITQVMGIVNGTTNYILSKMTDEMRPYAEVLAEAQALGLAEPDPTSDVGGFDAAYKLSILSSLAFHTRVPYDKVYREGIENVQVQDIAAGKDLGYRLKLLAIGKREGNMLDVRVHPVFLPDNHPLASVSDAFNAVFLRGHACDDIMLYGRGAGSMPTAGAIISDVVYALTQPENKYPSFEDSNTLHPSLSVTDNWQCGFYLCFYAMNRPGVLGHITTKLGQHGVSISSILQRKAEGEGDVPIIVITHRTFEKDLQAALKEIDPAVARVGSTLRVEGIE